MNEKAVSHRIKSLGSLLDDPHPHCPPVSSVDCCPVCGHAVVQQKCKVICRSELCVYRIIYNCSEF